MKKTETFPAYFLRKDGEMCAITAPNKMYLIKKEGTNRNAGITIDHFITRNQVRKYYGAGAEITREQFIAAYEALYSHYLQGILAEQWNIVQSAKPV